jgi:hypothetical protein
MESRMVRDERKAGVVIARRPVVSSWLEKNSRLPK